MLIICFPVQAQVRAALLHLFQKVHAFIHRSYAHLRAASAITEINVLKNS